MEENRTETHIELFRTLPFEYSCEDTTFMPYLESCLSINDSVNNFMFNRMADAHKKMSVSELEHLVCVRPIKRVIGSIQDTRICKN